MVLLTTSFSVMSIPNRFQTPLFEGAPSPVTATTLAPQAYESHK